MAQSKLDLSWPLMAVESEVMEYLKQCAAAPYVDPEPSPSAHANGLAIENSMCRDYPDPES